MTEGKLIIRNVRKNIQDYMIYFLTLTVSVSMFYAFNSIQTQPALNDLDATKQFILFPYCKEYLFILLLFTPASILQVLFQNLIVTAGSYSQCPYQMPPP